MGKIRNIGAGTAGVLGFIFYCIAGLLGTAIHVWTIIIAFLMGGLFLAIISTFFPVLAQIYWGIKVWAYTGTFLNYYCLALLGYVLLWVLALGGFAVAGLTSSD